MKKFVVVLTETNDVIDFGGPLLLWHKFFDTKADALAEMWNIARATYLSFYEELAFECSCRGLKCNAPVRANFSSEDELIAALRDYGLRIRKSKTRYMYSITDGKTEKQVKLEDAEENRRLRIRYENPPLVVTN